MTVSLESIGLAIDDLGEVLAKFLQQSKPRLLGLGEPTHGEETFLRLRNEAFRYLVEHEGYRSIALESDCLAGMTVDAFVENGDGWLVEVMRTGFSHGFGDSEGNRELVDWMRQYNETHTEKLRFYGADGPLEMTGAESPRPALTAVHAYLTKHVDLPWTATEIDRIAGEDDRWSNADSLMDPAKSIGRSDEAVKLRLIADDLVALLTAESPRLISATSHDEWWRASWRARAAVGLLRYHAGLADTSDTRLLRLVGLRDAIMADNLKDIMAREEQRGPTLVFTHNSHLQKDASSMQLGPHALEWWSAGAIAGAQLGDRYAFVATSLGTSARLDVDVPAPDTLEGILSGVAGSRTFFESRELAEALRDKALVPRKASTFRVGPVDNVAGTDGIVFLKEIL